MHQISGRLSRGGWLVLFGEKSLTDDGARCCRVRSPCLVGHPILKGGTKSLMGGEANKLKTNSTCRDLGGKHQEAEASNCRKTLSLSTLLGGTFLLSNQSEQLARRLEVECLYDLNTRTEGWNSNFHTNDVNCRQDLVAGKIMREL